MQAACVSPDREVGMRVRCIAFLPPAAVVTGVLFFLTSSIVSAIDQTLLAPSDAFLFEGSSFAPSNRSARVPGHLVGPLLSRAAFDEGAALLGTDAEADCGLMRRRARAVAGARLECVLLSRVCSAESCEVVEPPLPTLEESLRALRVREGEGEDASRVEAPGARRAADTDPAFSVFLF